MWELSTYQYETDKWCFMFPYKIHNSHNLSLTKTCCSCKESFWEAQSFLSIKCCLWSKVHLIAESYIKLCRLSLCQRCRVTIIILTWAELWGDPVLVLTGLLVSAHSTHSLLASVTLSQHQQQQVGDRNSALWHQDIQIISNKIILKTGLWSTGTMNKHIGVLILR